MFPLTVPLAAWSAARFCLASFPHTVHWFILELTFYLSNDPNFFQDNRAVNVRTLKNVDVDKLNLRKVDGKSKSLTSRPTPKSPGGG